MKQRAKERFEKHVDRTGDCHIWTGYKRLGYGRFRYQRSLVTAHRMAWFLHFGEWPKNDRINHLCCNPACVRIEHLEDVSHQEDANYKVSLGRQSKGSHRPNSKLTEEQVRMIKNEYVFGKNGSYKLARKYGVDPKTIYSIISGKKWKHVT